MRKTRYFTEQVLRKRPYLRMEWIERVVSNPLRRDEQQDGRIRMWGWIAEQGKYLRVVWLSDNETLHNPSFDRDFEPSSSADTSDDLR